MENGYDSSEVEVFCKKCKTAKPISAFYTSKKSGKRVYPCKSCKREYYREWAGKNPEYHTKWKAGNRDKVKEHNKRYREKRKSVEHDA